MAEMFLPVMSHFENENPWSASAGRLRFLIRPAEDHFSVQIWEGPWALEFSHVEEDRSFPFTEEGLAQIPVWLEEKRQEMENRPTHTLAENIARRDAAEAEHAKKEEN